MDELLRSICWHADKLFRKRRHFASVLFLTEKAHGHRQLFETGCQAPKSVTATDQQLVQALAEEMHEDFAISGVTKFCVAYLARRVTVIKPLDPNSSMRPSTTKRRGVVIELHSAEAQARIFREIVHCGGKCLLGAPETLDEPITASPYFDLLPRAIASSDGVVTVH